VTFLKGAKSSRALIVALEDFANTEICVKEIDGHGPAPVVLKKVAIYAC
jgi:hypothetical protein